MTLKRLSAIALAVSTALTLSACSGSESKTAYGLANASNPLVNKSNTTNASNTNTNNADTSTNTDTSNTDTGNNTPQGNSSEFTSTTPIDYSIFQKAGDDYRKEVPRYYFAGKTRGSLHDELAKAYNQVDADGNSRFQTTEGYRATANGKTYYSTQSIPIASVVGNGYHAVNMNETSVTHIDGVRYTGERASTVKLYQQDHSLVLGRQTLSGQISDGTTPKTLTASDLRVDNLKGTPTDPKQFETLHNNKAYFTYKGQAFSKEGVGNLEYSVDFIDFSGSGKITGLSDKGTINLNQANFVTVKHTNPDDQVINLTTGEPVPNVINSIGISGKAHFESGAKDGTYTLGFFGPEAVEIAGFVTENGHNTVGFGGKKQ